MLQLRIACLPAGPGSLNKLNSAIPNGIEDEANLWRYERKDSFSKRLYTEVNVCKRL